MMLTTVGSTGRAAAAAGVLMVAGTQGEWLLNPQRDDGTVTNMPAFVLLLTMSTIGFALLTLAVRGLRRESARRTKPARAGAFLSLAGAGLLTAFGLVALITGVILKAPLELSFLLFALGMLSLSIGQVSWGLTLRRHAPVLWQLLALAGIAAFAAIAIPVDPWHDVALVVMCATWSALGVHVIRSPRRQVVASPDHGSCWK
jgi:drug/metabolite transporter (DMT)-like permease